MFKLRSHPASRQSGTRGIWFMAGLLLIGGLIFAGTIGADEDPVYSEDPSLGVRLPEGECGATVFRSVNPEAATSKPIDAVRDLEPDVASLSQNQVTGGEIRFEKIVNGRKVAVYQAVNIGSDIVQRWVVTKFVRGGVCGDPHSVYPPAR